MLKENTLVPKMRFAEFEGEWVIIPMGNIFSSSKLKGQEGLPTLSVTLDRGLVLRDNNERETKTNLSAEEHRLVKKGEIAYNMMRMWQGAYGRAFCDGLVSPAYVILKQNNLLRSDFSEYFLKLTRTKHLLWSYSYGVTNDRLRLYYKDFAKIKATIPNLPEQKKIASFLTSVDDRIEQLKRKKTLLTSFKKGVMQRLFSNDECGVMNDEFQHNETTQNPASGTIQHSSLSIHHSLRFRNEKGEPYPDWQEKKLGEVSDVRDGTHETPKYVTTGFPLITSKNLSKDGSLIWDNVDYISESDYVDINRRSKVDIGDILFGMIGTIGNPVLVKEDGYAIKNVALIKMLDALSNDYLIQFLSSSFIAKQFHEKNAGGTQKFIALGVIRKLDILVPSLPEQTKIANYLSSLDTKINQVTQQITQTQTFKKGLLQQMFV